MSGEGRAVLKRSVRTPSARGNLLQPALNMPSPPEETAVHLVEIVITAVEQESAGDADCDADGAVVEFDRKALNKHGDLLPASGVKRSERLAPVAFSKR
jgi:hypothetical protein